MEAVGVAAELRWGRALASPVKKHVLAERCGPEETVRVADKDTCRSGIPWMRIASSKAEIQERNESGSTLDKDEAMRGMHSIKRYLSTLYYLSNVVILHDVTTGI